MFYKTLVYLPVYTIFVYGDTLVNYKELETSFNLF